MRSTSILLSLIFSANSLTVIGQDSKATASPEKNFVKPAESKGQPVSDKRKAWNGFDGTIDNQQKLANEKGKNSIKPIVPLEVKPLSISEKLKKRNELIDRAVDLESSIKVTLGVVNQGLNDSSRLLGARRSGQLSSESLDSYITRNLQGMNRSNAAYRNFKKATALRTQLKSCLSQIDDLNEELGFPRSDFSHHSREDLKQKPTHPTP